MKKKYSVVGVVSGSKYLGTYTADSEEEALNMAAEDAHVSMCHQCDSECEDPEITDMVAEEIK